MQKTQLGMLPRSENKQTPNKKANSGKQIDSYKVQTLKTPSKNVLKKNYKTISIINNTSNNNDNSTNVS